MLWEEGGNDTSSFLFTISWTSRQNGKCHVASQLSAPSLPPPVQLFITSALACTVGTDGSSPPTPHQKEKRKKNKQKKGGEECTWIWTASVSQRAAGV